MDLFEEFNEKLLVLVEGIARATLIENLLLII